MIDSENDTGVPPKDRQALPISRWDLLIPAALFVAVAGLLFLALQKDEFDSHGADKVPLASIPTSNLLKRQRTAEVARELLRRQDVSLPTAESCVRRLAIFQEKTPSEICRDLILQLPNETPEAVQKRWVMQLSKSGTINVPDWNPENDVAWRILLAGQIQKSPSCIPERFNATKTANQAINLLLAISLIDDQTAGEACLLELRRLIISPACDAPETADPGFVLATIDSITAMNVPDKQKSDVLCDLAIAGVCPAACFRELSRLPLESISVAHRGHVAAAVLDYLFMQSGHSTTSHDAQILLFSNQLADAFHGPSRERYTKRLAELQQQDKLTQTVETSTDNETSNQ